jgi:hypothetical protein
MILYDLHLHLRCGRPISFQLYNLNCIYLYISINEWDEHHHPN